MLAISRGTHKTRHASNANDFQKISIAGTEHPAPSHKVGGQIKLVYYGTSLHSHHDEDPPDSITQGGL